MSELVNIWREIASGNRFGETKLVFFIGLCLGILGLQNSPDQSFSAATVARGGSSALMVPTLILCILLALMALIPQLSPGKSLPFIFPKSKRLNIYYFLDIASLNSSAEWLALTGIEISDREKARAAMLADQTYVVAKIAAKKFLLLRYSTIILCIGWVASWAPLIVASLRSYV